MAGDWAKIEHSTPEKPEMMRIAAAMGISLGDAFLAVFRVWVWFDLHSYDGRTWMDERNERCARSVTNDARAAHQERNEQRNERDAKGVTLALLSSTVGVPGIAEAMKSVGWLLESDLGLEVPNFDRHVSETAKGRALAQKRNQKSRGEAHQERNERCARSVTNDARAALPHRREEKSNTKKTKGVPFVSSEPGIPDSEEPDKKPLWGKPPIQFSPSTRVWVGVSALDLERWHEAYPAIDIGTELAKAANWVVANPARGRKSNYAKFLTSWLSRAQDRAPGSVGAKKGASDPVRPKALTDDEMDAYNRMAPDEFAAWMEAKR